MIDNRSVQTWSRSKRCTEHLRDQAAPEFNWLLTEPPFQTLDGLDFGWFCREHAFCTAVVSALLGVSCDVVRGDFLVRAAGGECTFPR